MNSKNYVKLRLGLELELLLSISICIIVAMGSPFTIPKTKSYFKLNDQMVNKTCYTCIFAKCSFAIHGILNFVLPKFTQIGEK